MLEQQCNTKTLALIAILLSVVLASWVSASQDSPPAPTDVPTTSMVITADMIGQRYPPLVLSKIASTAEYGYSEKFPIKIGGGVGSKDIYRYLNSLLGPQGQKVRYDRVGSCCTFETANSSFGGKGLLEVYEVTYDGIEKPLRLYFNWYDTEELFIPKGFTGRK